MNLNFINLSPKKHTFLPLFDYIRHFLNFKIRFLNFFDELIFFDTKMRFLAVFNV